MMSATGVKTVVSKVVVTKVVVTKETLLASIHLKCYECMGGRVIGGRCDDTYRDRGNTIQEIAVCTCQNCSLFPLRWKGGVKRWKY